MVTAGQFVEWSIRKDSQNSWRYLRTAPSDAGPGLQVRRSDVHVSTYSAPSVLELFVRTDWSVFVLRENVQPQQQNLNVAFLRNRRFAARWLWIWFAGVMAALHNNCPQAGEANAWKSSFFQPKYFSILLPSNFWLFPSPLLNFIVPELHLCLSYYMMVLIICLRVSGIKQPHRCSLLHAEQRVCRQLPERFSRGCLETGFKPAVQNEVRHISRQA